MKIGADVTNGLIVSAVAVVVSVAGFSVFAGDRVKSGDYAESGRQIDERVPANTGDSKSFWRAMDDEGKPVRTGDIPRKSARAAADEDGTAVKTSEPAKNFWRAVNEDGQSVKTRAATSSGRTLNRNQAENRAQVFEPAE